MPKKDIFTLKEWAERHDVRNARIEPDVEWIKGLKKKTNRLYDTRTYHPMWLHSKDRG
jgi:hypothetical protein